MIDSIQLPSQDENPTETVQLNGFVHLVKLYKPFDEISFGHWNRSIHDEVPPWLVQLQRQLQNALPTYLEGTETQIIDLELSQQWVKTMTWQLAISHGLVSAMASDNTLSSWFPIETSRDLVEWSAEFSQRAMEVHVSGIVKARHPSHLKHVLMKYVQIEKLYDVACALADIMACVPHSQAPYDMGPSDYLTYSISLISSLRIDKDRFLPLPHIKIAEALPEYSLQVLPMLPLNGNVLQSSTPSTNMTAPTLH